MIQVCLLRIQKRLTDSDHSGGDHDLVGHLGVLTSTWLSHMLDLEGVNFHKFLHRCDSFVGATNHGHKLTILCTDIAARDRGVDRVHSSLLGECSDLLGKSGTARRVVHERGAALHVLQDTRAVVENHVTHVVRVSEHQEKVVGILGDFLRLHELSSSCDKFVSL